jgi:hypothetical protein
MHPGNALLRTTRQRAYLLKPVFVQNALYNIMNYKAIQEQTTTKNRRKQRQREGKEKAKGRTGQRGSERGRGQLEKAAAMVRTIHC